MIWRLGRATDLRLVSGVRAARPESTRPATCKFSLASPTRMHTVDLEEGSGTFFLALERLTGDLEPIVGNPYISPTNIIQRPKVVYSEATGEYHMWWHADNSTYGLLLQGLATSPTIQGPYTFVSATAPLGNWSQDFGFFTDYKDGRSYALYSNGDSVEGRDVYLTAYNENVTALDKVTYRFPKFDLEAPTIVQTDKSYYALMSHKTGYRPNNVVAFRADSLSGPWSQPWIVAPLNTRTFNSQSGFTLRIVGKKKTTYLYLGDQVG
jgi:hypothetical protein